MKGIIMSGNHPKLILDGLKTMTRRTWGLEFINPDPDAFKFLRMESNLAVFRKLRNSDITMLDKLPPLLSFPKKTEGVDPDVLFYIKCPYGQVGDRLWVRETFEYIDRTVIFDAVKIRYSCDEQELWSPTKEKWAYLGIDFKKIPSIFMPRWASRITLEITGVRVERLREITEEDAIKEGAVAYYGNDTAWGHFSIIWDSLNAKRGFGWSINPWVWCISFRRIQ